MAVKKFIIIDANSIVHRAFHALPPLTTKDGVLVNAVYGFTTILLRVLKDLKPDYVACCFDVSKDTFRKREFQAYKAHRKEQPSELYHQFPLIKELLAAFNVPVYEQAGYEADDLIGTISKLVTRGKRQEIKNIIVSGDLDTLQLIDNQTEVYTMKRGVSDTIIYDAAAVKERFGFGPEKLIDYKALRGDASDNIPGVRGIGEKTAGQLIQEYGSLDGLYKEIKKYKDIKGYKGNKILKEGVIKKLMTQEKEAYLSQKLATIVRDVKIDFNLDDCQVEPFDTVQVVKLFQAWQFNRLIAQIPQAEKVMYEKQGTLFERQTTNDKQLTTIKSGYCLIQNRDDFENFIDKLKQQEQFALDTETDGLNPFENKLIGMSFSWEKGKAYYLPRQQTTNNKQLTTRLKNILEDEKIKKIGHNIKFDYEVLDKFGIQLQGLAFDTMVGSYLLNPGTRQHNLDALAFTELGYKTQPITDLIGEKKSEQINLSAVPVEKVANYACEDADLTWQLYLKLSAKLDEALIEGVLEKIEMPLIPILAEMEKTGIKLDVKFLKNMSRQLTTQIASLETKIFKLSGHKFNVASPKQLKEVLFTKLKIATQGLGRTKTGISTAADELDKLKGRHKIIDLILEHRELSKLKNTYLDPLPTLVDKDQRVHTSFNQTITATGRLSSSEPNLQNIPIRTDLGKEVRRAFIADQGYQILTADYSQIELRIAASLANDKNLLAAFAQKTDIHTQTASKIFDVSLDKVTRQMRRQAKAVNFGILYGQGPHGLAAATGISYAEAQEFIAKYFEVFEDIHQYIENTINLTREQGYVETLFGRRRYLPEINAQHQQMRAQAERMAINHPVQGTAADLMKLAMIKVEQHLKKEFAPDDVKMLLQVHDELVFEVKDKLIPAAKKTIQHAMETVYQLRTPIEVEVEVGQNWGEAK